MLQQSRTEGLFNRAYDALVAHAGASESMREHFLYTCCRWTREDPYQTREFRFMGSLGMGGKFWLSPKEFRVSAYQEDITPARRNALEKVNVELAKLFVLPEVEVPDDGEEGE